MRVRVLAFARIREVLGGSAHAIELRPGSTGRDLWEALCAGCEALCPLTESTRIARNGRVVRFEEPLEDGDEIALLPPVGGG